MEGKIKKIRYHSKVSKKAKYMRLEIRSNGSVNVVLPQGMDHDLVERFLMRKSQWIINKLNHFKSVSGKIFLNGNKREYSKYKERARLLAESRIEYYSRFYNFKIHPVKFREAEISQKVKLFNRVNRITIKNTKSRWGSCSKKGNLNFNYKIALLSQELADYVIVHELCHLGEFNHSKRFWKLVSLTIPNYRELKRKFK